MKKKLSVIVGLLTLASAFAHAGTNGFVVPAFRGQAGALFAGWERFTVASGSGVGLGNTPDLPGSTALANLIQVNANAIITGTGNIYNQTGKSLFEIRETTTVPLDKLVLQVRTAGTELDYTSVKLTINAAVLPTPTRTELDRSTFGVPNTPGSGAFVSSLWEWDLAGVHALLRTGSYQIQLAAADPSLSFDSATLDTIQAVPEPGTWALLGAGAAVLAIARLRRKQR